MKRLPTGHQHPNRLALESLEDRCLLSAGFAQVNLASDVPGLARVTDPNLINPWGMSFSPTGPFWFGDNGSGVSDLLDGRGAAIPLVVAIPSAVPSGASPTGTVFNGGDGFAVSENGVAAAGQFLFASEDGTISAWAPAVDPTNALLAVDNSSLGSVYKGLAIATDAAGHSFLYAADFGRGTIDVFDEDFKPVTRRSAFQDANLPAGFGPFNIQTIGKQLYVTYARQDAARQNDVAGPGNGFIDVYGTDGSLVKRFASEGPLNSPWGLAQAPATFGSFGNDILVGNTGDGRINAYDPKSGAFLGQFVDDNGTPITIPVLWGLTVGNGFEGGDADTLFFTAGVGRGQHGLFGALQAPGKHGADTGGAGTFDPNASGERPDYPLPPTGGPALPGSGEDRVVPVAILLPLTQSSLALAPTLSTAPQPETQVVSPPIQAAPIVPVAYYGSVATPVSSSDASTFIPAADNVLPPASTPNNAVPLNSFLDLKATRTDPAPRAEVLLAQPKTDPNGTSLSDRGPIVLAPLPGDQTLAAASLESRPEGSGEALADSMWVETPDHGSRAKAMGNLFGVVSGLAAWCWLQKRRGKSQPALAAPIVLGVVTRCIDPIPNLNALEQAHSG